MHFPVLAVAFTALLAGANAFSAKRDQSFVIIDSGTSSDMTSRSKRDAVGSTIKSLHVVSVIVSRFARVTFQSTMVNDDDVAREKVFSVRLPNSAFITEFNMIVDGVTFVGKVKEKEVAKEQYDRAVERGNTAGLVVADVRETRTFDVSANVPAHSSVDFHLVYQQLLNRKLGLYDHTIMVNPGQLIDEFVVEVFITESSGITSLNTEFPIAESGVRNKASRDSNGRVYITTETRRSRSQAKVSFRPTPTEQRRFLSLPEDQQKFTVRYDVTREVLGGEIQTRNGYFVHFFAPEKIPVLPKRVVFVIDKSGSMMGRKIEQTKTALVSIIKDLRESDKFNIVAFSHSVKTWKNAESGVVDVTTQNVREAIAYVKKIDADGSTNLNGAIEIAANLLNVTMEDRASSMIILLTDGMPTSGVTDTAQIRMNARKEIAGRFSLFCLGFGDDVDQEFLKRLATENDGIARKIYEDSDADLQLEGFFQEVATPLLLNIKMTYTGANLTDLSRLNFDGFFKGSETVVVGAYDADEDKTKIESKIDGESVNGPVVYQVSSSEVDDTFSHWYKDTGEFDNFIERLWAYFTIRNLLEKITLAEDKIEIEETTNRIIHLALKYKFVTPLTSMVVTLPEDELTTTTVGPEIRPPMPPCYARGSVIPNYIMRPPIWCPVILDPTLSSSSRGSGRPPSRSSGRRIIGSSSSRRPSASRSLGGSSGARSLRIGFPIPYSPRSDPKPRKKCGGRKTGTSGIIELPPTDETVQVFTCKWRIVVQNKKWIDLHIERANTTKNQVVIQKRGKTIYEHNGGVSSSKFVSVAHHKVDILFTIYEDDTVRPGIVITYQEFTPEEHTGSQSSILPGRHVFDESMVNCGRDISSSQSLSGFISSPGYPKTYPESAYCIWELSNDAENRTLVLTFLDIDIEASNDGSCPNDKVIVMGNDEEQVFCGHQTPDSIVIEEKIAKISFLSDAALGAGGFRLRYDFVHV